MAPESSAQVASFLAYAKELLGDAVAEELYLAAADARAAGGRSPAVHLFPCRMNDANWRTFLAPLCAGRPELETFWRSLRTGFEQFERTRQVPSISVDTHGQYLLE